MKQRNIYVLKAFRVTGIHEYKNSINRIFVIVLFLTSFNVFSQSENANDKQMVRDAYSELRNSFSSDSLAHHLHYKVSVFKKQDEHETKQVSELKIWSKGNILNLESSEVLIYKDGIDVFSVFPNQKIVHHTAAPQKMVDKDYFEILTDTIFNHIVNIRSSKTTEGLIKVSMNLSAKGREYFKIGTITCWLKGSNKQIYKIRLDRGKDNLGYSNTLKEYDAIEYEFLTLISDFKETLPVEDLHKEFFKAGNVLNTKYKNYKLVGNNQN